MLKIIIKFMLKISKKQKNVTKILNLCYNIQVLEMNG